LNNTRCNENITKIKRTVRLKRRKRGMTRGRDGNGGAVSNSDMTIKRVWRKRVKDTGVLGEVGGSAIVEYPLRGG
jgi:hypothetical protein